MAPPDEPRPDRDQEVSSEQRPRTPRHRPPPRYPYDDYEEISLLALFGVLLRHRWVVVGTPIVLALVVVLWSLFLTPRTWTSTASFTPQAGEPAGGRLQGLASQFGVSLPTGASASQTPGFYADLLRTEGLLSEAATSRYPELGEGAAAAAAFAGGSDSTPAADSAAGRVTGPTLVELYEVEADDSLAAVERAVEKLRDRLSVTSDAETGVVTVEVTAKDPVLARAVAARLLELVHRFNLESRHTQAAAQREFLAERVAEAREDLLAAEERLETFLENNRRFENSPQLVFEQQRLQRRVDLQQQIYTALSQSYEEARIDAVRTTPVITVVQEPRRPGRPDERGTLLKGVLALFLGGMVGVFWAFGREYASRAREEDSEEYEEVSSQWAEARREAQRALRRIKELFGQARTGTKA